MKTPTTSPEDKRRYRLFEVERLKSQILLMAYDYAERNQLQTHDVKTALERAQSEYDELLSREKALNQQKPLTPHPMREREKE